MTQDQLKKANQVLERLQTLEAWIKENQPLAEAQIAPSDDKHLPKSRLFFFIQVGDSVSSRSIPVPDFLIRDIVDQTLAYYRQEWRKCQKEFQEL